MTRIGSGRVSLEPRDLHSGNAGHQQHESHELTQDITLMITTAYR